MTKEQLVKEAEEYAEKHAFRVPYDGSNRFYDDVDFKASKEGYIAGAEPREKIIAKLEKLNKNQEESLGITLLEEDRKAKRIKELEVENAEIKAKYLQATDEGTSWAHLKKLESENAKLKSLLEEKHKVGNNEFWKTVWYSIWRNEELEKENERLLKSCAGATMMYQDLCKAIKIIKNLLTCCRNYPQETLEKIQQAEQFLQEENTKAPEAVDEVEKLKTLIRKMKRCQNCDNFDYTENKCKIGWCDNFEKWVLKEVVFVDLKELDDNEL